MKKTIAKIMAAAMILSAVPAVALPTLQSQAASSVSAGNVSTSTTFKENGTTTLESNGGTGLYVGSDASVSTDGKTITLGSGTEAKTIKLAQGSSGTEATNLFALVRLAISADTGEVLVTVDTSTSTKIQALIAAIKAGKNAVTLTQTDTSSVKVLNFLASKSTTIYIGGNYSDETTNGTYTSGVLAAGDNNSVELPSTAVYARFDGNNGLEILKNPNSDLDSYDVLRGQTVDLTRATLPSLGNSSLPVTKIGAQALKKGHFKKFYAENTKRVGKGALRGCKQVTKVDISDSNKVRKINSKAFYSCKNLKTIIIDGRKLNTVGKNAFAGVKKNCTVKIKAKKSKYNSDVKMIKKNGGNKNLKFVRKAP